MNFLIAPLMGLSLVLTVAVGAVALEAETEAPSPSPSPEPSALVDDRPDIIVVMVDDLGYVPNDRLLARLPNIRALWLEGGVRFHQAYNEIPLCCPARANFHSGQHSFNNGVVVNNWEGFDSSDTLATAMDDAGYHTIFVGKYLNGYPGSLVPPGWDDVMLTDGARARERNPAYWVNGELQVFKERFFDDVVRSTSVRWLKQAPIESPVFEVTAPYAPHRFSGDCRVFYLQCLLTPTSMKRDRGASECARIREFKPPSYSTEADFKAATLRVPKQWEDGWPLVPSCESLLVVDRMVGQLAKAQKARGRPGYFIFLSDNGMAWGQHGHPLKHVPWATRLPLYVAGPGIEPGTSSTRVSIIDVPVTVADIANATMPLADGVSFLASLGQGSSVDTGGIPASDGGFGRDEILELLPAPPRGSGDTYEGWAGIRSGRWRYIRWDRGLKELYEIDKDPWGLVNLAKRNRGVARRLDQRLDELIEESRGP